MHFFQWKYPLCKKICLHSANWIRRKLLLIVYNRCQQQNSLRLMFHFRLRYEIQTLAIIKSNRKLNSFEARSSIRLEDCKQIRRGLEFFSFVFPFDCIDWHQFLLTQLKERLVSQANDKVIKKRMRRTQSLRNGCLISRNIRFVAFSCSPTCFFFSALVTITNISFSLDFMQNNVMSNQFFSLYFFSVTNDKRAARWWNKIKASVWNRTIPRREKKYCETCKRVFLREPLQRRACLHHEKINVV